MTLSRKHLEQTRYESIREIDDVILAVLAAHRARDSRAWLELVRAEASDDLDAALLARKDELAASLDDGLGVSPAPRTRLDALRSELARLGACGFVVPRGDEFHNEYPPRCAERLQWLTGFAGSAGCAAVLAERAAIFVDGRYTLQAAEQVDAELFELRHLTEQPLDAYLLEWLVAGDVLAIDPWLHAPRELDRLERTVDARGATLLRLPSNPIDTVWAGRYARPLSVTRVQSEALAGESVETKIDRISADAKTETGAMASIITATDSVAWLANLRGGDLPHVPVFLAYGILEAGKFRIFSDLRRCPQELRDALAPAIEWHPLEQFEAALELLGRGGARVLVDQGSAPAAVVEILDRSGATVVLDVDPVAMAKACKNSVELGGSRSAHRRDGAAVSSFLHWVETDAGPRRLGEITLAEALLAERAKDESLLDLSFETISGAGPNGAIIHYRVTRESERHLEPGSLYLVDSGGQYADGTTDITRTVAIGEPAPEHRDRFTRVLKGHIALATALFPVGTTGSQLDILARKALWDVGLDYDHGTGHGVGSYLSVHEGPQRIAKVPSTVALCPGMILSNEPGYYKPGAYGIRIENLVAVVRAEGMETAEREMLAFETLTLAPIDRRLVDSALLTSKERRWLNAYHARVCEKIAPLVDSDTAAWLRRVTEPIRNS